MTDNHYRNAGSFRKPEQISGTFPDLPYTAGRRLQLTAVHSLDRIDDQKRRFLPFRLEQDPAHFRGRHNQQRIRTFAQATGPHSSLFLRLFPGNIKNLATLLTKSHSRIQQQCRLTDPRFAPQQYQAARDNAAAQHPVEFVDACGQTLYRSGCHPADRPGDFAFHKIYVTCIFSKRFHLLRQRIPGAAFRAFPQPGRRNITAILTYITGFYFGLSHANAPLPPVPAFLSVLL